MLGYIYWNIDIFAFFFPFKTKVDITKTQYKKKFSIKYFYLLKILEFLIKIKFLCFLIYIQIFQLFS